jgi:[protein-PII] uridylyltransferase
MNQISKQRDIVDRLALAQSLEAELEGAPYEASRRPAVLAILKEAYAAGTAEVRKRFEAGWTGVEVTRANAFLMDQLIRVIFDFAQAHVYKISNRTTGEQLSLVAIGGYGRRELAPNSDVDLMFLLPYKQTPHGEQIVEYILYLLWDLGLKVGHATRSIDDCMRLAKSDITIRTSLLDARWIWGDQSLFTEFQQRFQDDLVAGTGPQFVEAKLAERDQRHARMGDTRYVVEPNIKEGKGGLRDMQTLYWITKYLYGVTAPEELVGLKVFTDQDARRFTKAREFLVTVRCHLHYLAKRGEERLTFDIQTTMANRMGYTDRAGVRGVERFMKHYFLVAKDVGDLTRIICAALEEQQKKKRTFFRLPSLRRSPVIPGFKVDGERITVQTEDDFDHDPVKILRLFQEAHDHDLDIHPEALRLVTAKLHLITKDVQNDPEANRVFLALLTSKKDPEFALRRLNEAGVFGKFVPDFGRVVAQMQFDMYHTYTVDEHTIRAVGMLHKIETGQIADEVPVACQIIHEIQSRRALYVAVLIHDIAKGRGGDHSVLGAEVAQKLCPRLGLSDEETETVAWLVLHHLLMSNTAFKRDLNDPKTIADFCGVVQSVERLRLLGVLTVADIRAVGPGIWNQWKAGLLRDIYRRSLEHLSSDQVEEHREARIRNAQDRLRERLTGWTEDEIEEHLERGYPGYWLSFDTDTHVRHAEIVRAAEKQGLQLHIETRLDREFDNTEIIVYAADHPGLFSKIAGAMALSGANIVHAQIVTLSSGKALDIFRVQDADGGAYDDEDRLKRLWKRIEDALAGKIHLAGELDSVLKREIGPRTGEFRVAPRVLIDNKASTNYTVIEVNGRDRPGFLHTVTAALTSCGLQIASAQIMTYGERAVDVFYVKDVFGLKVAHERKVEQIREKLLHALESIEPESAQAAE